MTTDSMISDDRKVELDAGPGLRRVILESPYAGEIEANVAYARAAMFDCLERGEAPFASHLLYTQVGVLDDSDAKQRQRGIDAGLAWGVEAAATVVYTDRGISRGMQYGIDRAMREGRPVEYRSLPVAPDRAAPHPASSADAVERAVKIGRRAFYDYHGNESAVEVGIRAALAAIGAGGQAVAEPIGVVEKTGGIRWFNPPIPIGTKLYTHPVTRPLSAKEGRKNG